MILPNSTLCLSQRIDEDVKTSSEPSVNRVIAVTGSNGLVGSRLLEELSRNGDRITRLVRRNPGKNEVLWDPTGSTGKIEALNGVEAVVHLAGENIAAARWSADVKRRIHDSRVIGTRTLARALAGLPSPPKTLVTASAIGYYGDRGDEVLDEESLAGNGFLAEVAREWEAAAKPAVDVGIRVIHLRFGVILSPQGGALAKMFLPFKLGAGGRIGSGRQWWSWISLDDAVVAIRHAIETPSLSGPVNAVAPNPVTNNEFTKILRSVLGRPTILPMPAFAARLALGEMADHLLLASTRVTPRRLLETGFVFKLPELEGALRHLLSRPAVE